MPKRVAAAADPPTYQAHCFRVNGMGSHKKRSFLKLPVSIDVERLLADYRSIPALAWAPSYWDAHCSSSMLLLRGGDTDTEQDFMAHEVSDRSALAELPYFRWLLGEDGPFGNATYAFIFRMKPLGLSRPHVDSAPEWEEPFRIHIPLATNDDAFLLSEGRAKHLAVGEAWTFDNQVMHGALNGNTVRTHLIFDVPDNPRLDALLHAAEFDPGIEDPERWQRAQYPDAPSIFEPAPFTPLALSEKLRLGLNPEGFAARVASPRRIAQLRRIPLREGDIVYSVNQVDECPMALTAWGYIQLRHRPGETVELGAIRGGQRRTLKMKLHKEPSGLLLSLLGRVRGSAGQMN